MKRRTYIPLGRLISDVLIENGLVDHVISHNLMEDVTVDTGMPLNLRNLKSMRIIEKVIVKPSLDTSWEDLKDQSKIPNDLYLFSKIDRPELIDHYLQDLANQGVYISDFLVDWLPEHPPNFKKRQREPSEKTKKAKKTKLGEAFVSRPPVHLVSSPSKSPPPVSSTFHLRKFSSSLPQPSPIYTHSEPTTSTVTPSETPTSNPPSPPLQKLNLTTTTLPISEAQLFNELISPRSSTPSSPPYYNISSNSDESDFQSPTLAQVQARALYTQNPYVPKTITPSLYKHPQTPPFEPHIETPSENPITQQTEPPTETIPTPPTPIPTTSEPESTFLTLEEAIVLFDESIMEKIRSLSKNSRINDDPSAVRIHWNRVIRWMTSKAFKLKGLSEQVRNDFIREAGERLQARLDREAEEQARREGEEKARLEEEENAREAFEKATAEDAADVEAEAKAKADAEKVTRIAAEEAAKARDSALTQGESSDSDFAPLVLKTLEELQKEQQIMRARLDQ
ncbi:uncharacterized protein LOC127137164 [Lathyrus oleraceus]|uniref:uncharacterized protein LOC127137164 n=1 Tax=Pisum sativum TaxID=3888 RepID=UPI0021D08296|nr:uncharacterized protein LOC127137164 [Pisum sativum]